MVCGAAMYFSRMLFASSRSRSSIALPAASTAGGVGALLRVEQALVVVARELRVDRQPQRRPAAFRARPGSRIANSTRAPLPGTVSTLAAYCSGVNTCSSRPASCTSP